VDAGGLAQSPSVVTPGSSKERFRSLQNSTSLDVVSEEPERVSDVVQTRGDQVCLAGGERLPEAERLPIVLEDDSRGRTATREDRREVVEAAGDGARGCLRIALADGERLFQVLARLGTGSGIVEERADLVECTGDAWVVLPIRRVSCCKPGVGDGLPDGFLFAAAQRGFEQ